MPRGVSTHWKMTKPALESAWMISRCCFWSKMLVIRPADETDTSRKALEMMKWCSPSLLTWRTVTGRRFGMSASWAADELRLTWPCAGMSTTAKPDVALSAERGWRCGFVAADGIGTILRRGICGVRRGQARVTHVKRVEGRVDEAVAVAAIVGRARLAVRQQGGESVLKQRAALRPDVGVELRGQRGTVARTHPLGVRVDHVDRRARQHVVELAEQDCIISSMSIALTHRPPRARRACPSGSDTPTCRGACGRTRSWPRTRAATRAWRRARCRAGGSRACGCCA